MSKPEASTMDQAIQATCNTLMHFLLIAPGVDPEQARATIADMIRAYNPADTIELGLIDRIVGFGLAAMDSLRLSMADPAMTDAKVLRYRALAASLSRSAEQCRVALENLRIRSKPDQPAPARPDKTQAPPPAEVRSQNTHTDAKATLDRLDRLHREWNLNPIPASGAIAAAVSGASTASQPQRLRGPPPGYG